MIYLEIRDDLHVFSFFFRAGTIIVPNTLWFEALCASLRMKKEVLLLERDADFPTWDKSKRWQTGEFWCWISPRAMGFLLSDYWKPRSDFQAFKTLLSQFK